MEEQVREHTGLDKRTAVSAELPAIAQGGYYIVTGLWPVISMRRFERVTGPKVDKWLVNTVGVLVAAIGATLVTGGARRQITPEIKLLAIGSAAGLTAIDILYVTKGRISPVYLLDAVLETIILGLWRRTPPAAKEKQYLHPSTSDTRKINRSLLWLPQPSRLNQRKRFLRGNRKNSWR